MNGARRIIIVLLRFYYRNFHQVFDLGHYIGIKRNEILDCN